MAKTKAKLRTCQYDTGRIVCPSFLLIKHNLRYIKNGRAMAKGTVDQSRICGEERTSQQKNIKQTKQVEQFAREQIIDKYRHKHTTWLPQALPKKTRKN